MASNYKNLFIWQEGYRLLMKIYELTDKFPSSENFALSQQIRKSANSIIANIAVAALVITIVLSIPDCSSSIRRGLMRGLLGIFATFNSVFISLLLMFTPLFLT